jgi:hypothetical protein
MPIGGLELAKKETCGGRTKAEGPQRRRLGEERNRAARRVGTQSRLHANSNVQRAAKRVR